MPLLGVRSLWPRLKAQSSKLFEFAYFRVLFVFLRKSNFKTMIWSSTVCTLWEKLVIRTSQTLLGCLLPLVYSTGKSFSEALILASVNPQYDKRLFIEFP